MHIPLDKGRTYFRGQVSATLDCAIYRLRVDEGFVHSEIVLRSEPERCDNRGRDIDSYFAQTGAHREMTQRKQVMDGEQTCPANGPDRRCSGSA